MFCGVTNLAQTEVEVCWGQILNKGLKAGSLAKTNYFGLYLFLWGIDSIVLILPTLRFTC